MKRARRRRCKRGCHFRRRSCRTECFNSPWLPIIFQLARIDSGTEAKGKAVVAPAGGNRGEIIATLHFTSNGELTSVKEERNVQTGIRPMCQATRLLDSDPIVRAMAAQDLLIMGRAAMPYLREQRGTAQPELDYRPSTRSPIKSKRAKAHQGKRHGHR